MQLSNRGQKTINNKIKGIQIKRKDQVKNNHTKYIEQLRCFFINYYHSYTNLVSKATQCFNPFIIKETLATERDKNFVIILFCYLII